MYSKKLCLYCYFRYLYTIKIIVCTNKTMFIVPHRKPHREQLDNGYYLLKIVNYEIITK